MGNALARVATTVFGGLTALAIINAIAPKLLEIFSNDALAHALHTTGH